MEEVESSNLSRSTKLGSVRLWLNGKHGRTCAEGDPELLGGKIAIRGTRFSCLHPALLGRRDDEAIPEVMRVASEILDAPEQVVRDALTVYVKSARLLRLP